MAGVIERQQTGQSGAIGRYPNSRYPSVCWRDLPRRPQELAPIVVLFRFEEPGPIGGFKIEEANAVDRSAHGRAESGPFELAFCKIGIGLNRSCP
jgi:hypothetical protein